MLGANGLNESSEPTRRSTSGRPTVSVIIPAKNEARNLPHVFSRLPEGLHEVILVDGNSVDETAAAARRERSDVIVVNQTRRGKGNALACGFAVATGDILVMIDADGSTDPREIPAFVDALLSGADLAKGTRFAAGGGSEDITRTRRLGNSALNLLANSLYGTDCSDLCYGFMAFWATALSSLALPDIDLPQPGDGKMLWGDGFEVETLIAVRAAKSGMTIAEVPSVERDRIFGESNLNTFADGRRVLRTLFAERRRKVSSGVAKRSWRHAQPIDSLPLPARRVGAVGGEHQDDEGGVIDLREARSERQAEVSLRLRSS